MRSKLFAVVLIVGLMVIVYLLVSSQGSVPPMPRVRITEAEQKQVIEALNDRVRGFVATDREKALLARFFAKNRAEVAAMTLDEARPAAEEQVDAFVEDATTFAREAEDRYLLLGDFLALDFAAKLDRVLKTVREIGFEETLARDGSLLDALETSAGTFFHRATSQGLIDRGGGLRASRILPVVLYRVVWRSLGGVGLTVGFTRAEEKVYYDYLVAMYGKKSSERERLKAVHRLKGLDQEYDHILARAIVLYESGRTKEARDTLQGAIREGRDDAVIQRFVKALQ